MISNMCNLCLAYDKELTQRAQSRVLGITELHRGDSGKLIVTIVATVHRFDYIKNNNTEGYQKKYR